jgi:CheY-like chemotaxis protein
MRADEQKIQQTHAGFRRQLYERDGLSRNLPRTLQSEAEAANAGRRRRGLRGSCERGSQRKRFLQEAGGHINRAQNSGFIWVYTEPGLGTSFKIYLPRAKDARVAPQASLPVEDYSGGCETVLLAEDEPAVRQSTREFLSLNGYIVLEAKNGTDALAIAREYKSPIHLMITDVVMPQMGGAKLAGELAFERPDMKVLFVSGYAESTVQRHA